MVVSKEIKSYLKTWITSEEVKTVFNNLLAPLITQDSMESLLKKYVQEGILQRITDLETHVTSQQTELQEHQKKIDELEATAAVRETVIEKLEQKCDDNQQYSRRTSISHVRY